jgi:hypothetical protein
LEAPRGQAQGAQPTSGLNLHEKATEKELKILMSSEDGERLHLNAFYKAVDDKESHTIIKIAAGQRGSALTRIIFNKQSIIMFCPKN